MSRQIPLQFHRYFSDGRCTTHTIVVTISPDDIMQGTLLCDGRTVAETMANEAQLCDGTIVRRESILNVALPNLQGMTLDGWPDERERRIVEGPDIDGWVTLDDGLRMVMFGLMRSAATNPFPGQWDLHRNRALFEVDRDLRKEAGLIHMAY